ELSVSSLITVDVRGRRPPEVSVKASLDPFAIQLFGQPDSPTNFFSIYFKGLSFESKSGSAPVFQAPIDKVTFGPGLDFVKKLQDLLSAKNGPYADISPSGIEVGYRFSKDIEQFGGFTVQNIAFSIAALLPLTNQPARFVFRLASQQKPFLISAGI